MNSRTGGYIDRELKFADYYRSYAFTSAWTVCDPTTPSTLSAVAQGDGESQRDGRVYHMDSIHLKGQIQMTTAKNESVPQPYETVRVALVLDTQSNGATIAASDVFDTVTGPDYLSFRNLQYTKRFRVLWDHSFSLHPNNAPDGNTGVNVTFTVGGGGVEFKKSITFKSPIKVVCKGTTAAIASITDNSLHMVALASDDSLGVLDYTSRLRFTG
jgi:hypothetical protein